ncbi:Uncharacterised protein [Achromobacter xylosoxidans]|uniref:hypothetical protein n=1 Tax=Alcaligenes xylosoxydans xylosoxydans TaxID=85698 RepID=UPI0006C28F76|nr:hypothetical protein [Achromobacter xylosoxidans]CUJ42200.1 Uncharacterised protein [Achromobacter xylosoxidans]
MKENNAAQAVEQDPINAAILLLTEEADSISDCHTRTLGDWAGEPEAKAHYDHVRSVVDALSQLRAPVADERAAVDPCGYVAVKVAAVDWLKDKFPALTIKAGLCERIGGRLYTITRLMRDHDAALASAPVAGEAKNYPGDNVAERLDKMADGQPPGSQAQSDLYAAATIWRKHIAHRAAPQASAVAGEAVTWEAVRQELAIFLMGATGRSSKEWHRPLDNASEGGALARMRACLAAPQASAENVRNAALEEAIQAVSGITTSYAVFTSGNPQYRPESRPASAAIAEAIETLRALKRSQADKDGGQQRAGDAFPDYMHDLRYHDQFRIGWNRCVDAYRAALSASQAEQGEREDG